MASRWLRNLLIKFYVHIFKTPWYVFDSEDEVRYYQEAKKAFRKSIGFYIDWGLRIINLIIIFIIGYFLIGCSATPVTKTEYKYVNVPVKCEVVMPIKPPSTGDVIKDNLLIMQYADETKAALLKCK